MPQDHLNFVASFYTMSNRFATIPMDAREESPRRLTADRGRARLLRTGNFVDPTADDVAYLELATCRTFNLTGIPTQRAIHKTHCNIGSHARHRTGTADKPYRGRVRGAQYQGPCLSFPSAVSEPYLSPKSHLPPIPSLRRNLFARVHSQSSTYLPSDPAVSVSLLTRPLLHRLLPHPLVSLPPSLPAPARQTQTHTRSR